MDETKELWERYSRTTHLLGRVSSILCWQCWWARPF